EPVFGQVLHRTPTPGLLLPAAAVALEDARRRELAELVPDHVLGHEQPRVLLAVVDHERGADELRDDGAVARPGPHRLAVLAMLLVLAQQPGVDVRAFLQRTAHRNSSASRRACPGGLLSTRRVARAGPAAADDRLVGRLALRAGLAALGRHAGRAARV